LPVTGRYRPVILFDQEFYGFAFFQSGYEGTSFASGHAVTAFSLAFSLAILFPKCRTLFFAAAIAIALSRVLLTSHFLGDVIFGAYIGIATVWLLSAYFDRKGWALSND
jgi:membrane-associated phospholipid phosphatase